MSYVLGFCAPDTAANDKYRKLKVTLRGSIPYVVQARPATLQHPLRQPRTRSGSRGQRRFIAAGLRRQRGFSIGSRSQGGYGHGQTQIHVAINQLTFPIRDHRRVQQLKLVVALLDAAGNIVAAKEGTMDFAMSEATYTRLSAIGINAGLNLDAPPGAYHLRVVVQESVNKKMSSTTLPVEMR